MILLIYPKHSPFPHSISTPLSIFSLGSYIEQRGGEVEYFDERLQGWDRLFQLLDKRPLLVGISTMTSYQIKRAIAIASSIRRNYPDIQLAWGGVHPTMCPHQTAESRLVDFVIKGEGEATLCELADALNNSSKVHLPLIDGLVWKEDGNIKENKDRHFLNIDELPFSYTNKAGKMIGAYLNTKTSRESIAMETSRGCNFSCSFCYNSFFNKSTCRPKSKEKLEGEFGRLKEMGVSEVIFVDDNLGASSQHIRNLCEITHRYNIKWSGAIRLDIIDEELLKILENGGCRYLFFGIESINPETLKYIAKDINLKRINQLIKWVSKSSIVAVYSFMNGFPNESADNLTEQLDFIGNLHKIDPKAEIAIQPYNPLAGTPLFKEAVKNGFKPPKILEGWWKMTTGETLGPWVEDKALLKNLYLISFLAFRSNRFLKHIIFFPLYKIAKLRWKKRFFRFCFERYLFILMVRICTLLDRFIKRQI